MFERNPHTKEVATLLERVKIGETITYEEMTKQIGVDVKRRGILASVRRRLLLDQQISFRAVPEGLRREDDIEKVEHGTKYVGKVHRAARRGREHLASVDNFGAMPAKTQVVHNTGMAALGAIENATSPKKIKALAEAVDKAQKELPPKETLKLFSE